MEVKVPTLLIDEEKCRQNISKMKAKCRDGHAHLRPHFKTHLSADIAHWYSDQGIHCCTVSSVGMAAYFASHGWHDITIAFPYNLLEHEAINQLAGKIQLNILIESEESLSHAQIHLTNPVGVFVKIDVGYHRTGMNPADPQALEKLIGAINGPLSFRGFLAHAGHTYGTQQAAEIKQINDRAKEILAPLQKTFGGILSYGDTPSCSSAEDLSVYDELRPGNFVFYDWMQHEIGACNVHEIAVCMACPIVALHPSRQEVVIYGGAVHLSKDFVSNEGRRCYGKAVRLTKKGWETDSIGHVDRISQEHGILKVTDEVLRTLAVGQLIGVIPVHSCLTAACQGHYLSTNGQYIQKYNPA